MDEDRHIMSELIRKLTDVQRAHGWSDEELAEACGVKSRMLALVRSGRSRFGIVPLGTIARNFPGLRQDVLDYLIVAAGPVEVDLEEQVA